MRSKRQNTGRDRHTVQPRSRYRNGARDTAARLDHARQSRQWRREIAFALFNPQDQHEFFQHLRAGATIVDAAAKIGQTHQAVYARARWDPAFRHTFEEVLAETCPAGEWCGTATGVKRGGHCSLCREAHHPSRSKITRHP